jgi:hypothetical protein
VTHTHLFTVNGDLGTFSVRFPRSTRGQVQLQVRPRDPSDAPTGRATTTVALDGSAKISTSVTLVRRLAGTASLVGGVPGGRGNRDGDTGPNSQLTARLDRPLGMAILDGTTYLLSHCALRRVKPVAATGTLTVETVVPCRAGAPLPSGAVANLTLATPVAIAADPGTHRLFISDGPRVISIAVPAGSDAAAASYVDFSQGLIRRATGIAVGPYREKTKDGPFDTLWVADGDANLLFSFPLSGAAASAAAGVPGACAPLTPGEQATTLANPIPPIAAAQAHLCMPDKVDVGLIANDPTQWGIFIADRGHQAVRLYDPINGVTTLLAGIGDITAVAYKHFDQPLGIPLTAGVAAFAAANQFGYYTQYASTSTGQFKQGTSSVIMNDGQPGYTEQLDLLTSFGSKNVRFDDVEQLYRPLLDDVGSAVLGQVQLALVQAGNSVVQAATGSFHIAPLYGVGPHRGQDRASLGAGPAAVFRAPAGLAWGGAGTLFVADQGNHAIAQLAYDPTRLPLAPGDVVPAVGCPGAPGDLDGAASDSRLRAPHAIAWDAMKSDLYVADTGNASLRRVHFDASGAATEIHTVLGADGATFADCDLGVLDAGAPAAGFLGVPSLLAFDDKRRVLWVAHADAPDVIAFSVDDASPQLSPLTFPGEALVGLAIIGKELYAVDLDGSLMSVDLDAASPSVTTLASLLPTSAQALALGSDGEWLYLADDRPMLTRIDPWAGLAADAIAGDGILGLSLATQPVGLNRIGGIAYEAQLGLLFIADSAENSLIVLQ